MNKLFKVLLGVLALSLVLLSGCGQNSAGSPAESLPESDAASGVSSDSKSSGEPIRFEGSDLEGNPISSDIFSQSKLTMVNVWATYCNFCLNEMPDLGELAAEYDTEDFQIIGIVSDVPEGSDLSLVKELVEQTGAGYPHLLLNESIYYGLLTDVTALPTTFFLDENGVVLDVVIGSMKKTAWEEQINGLLDKD